METPLKYIPDVDTQRGLSLPSRVSGEIPSTRKIAPLVGRVFSPTATVHRPSPRARPSRPEPSPHRLPSPLVVGRTGVSRASCSPSGPDRAGAGSRCVRWPASGHTTLRWGAPASCGRLGRGGCRPPSRRPPQHHRHKQHTSRARRSRSAPWMCRARHTSLGVPSTRLKAPSWLPASVAGAQRERAVGRGCSDRSHTPDLRLAFLPTESRTMPTSGGRDAILRRPQPSWCVPVVSGSQPRREHAAWWMSSRAIVHRTRAGPRAGAPRHAPRRSTVAWFALPQRRRGSSSSTAAA
jgi:hypothetical protein